MTSIYLWLRICSWHAPQHVCFACPSCCVSHLNFEMLM